MYCKQFCVPERKCIHKQKVHLTRILYFWTKEIDYKKGSERKIWTRKINSEREKRERMREREIQEEPSIF